MNAVTKRQETAVAVADYAASLLEVIASAARDPSVDIDKMERLIAMQERVQARDAEVAFNVAMNAAQGEMRPISADATNPQTKSQYATYAKLDAKLRPVYTKHGFSLSFDEGETDRPDYVRVVCFVSHVGGHTRIYHRDMPADGKGAKGGDVMTKTHAAGAAGSYGSRYLLKGIFNIAVGDDDSDGNAPLEEMPADKWAILVAKRDASGANIPAMLRFLNISLPDNNLQLLNPEQYERVIEALDAKLAAKAKAETNAKAQD